MLKTFKRGIFTGDTALVLFVLLVVLWIPWLGETPFYSKGEPREAVVAMSMLQSGDWVLPVNAGSEIPFKPPFLAWMIAVFAWVFNGGVVNEFIARLPSAIAAVAMIMGGYYWVKECRGKKFAFTMALVTATSIEVFRAATACRLDMVLTACMVGAIYMVYTARERRDRDNVGLWAGAALLLTIATMTKGPVGSLLPCLVLGIYLLVRKDNFFKTLGKMVLLCAVSFLLPALWYYAAWKRGGDAFIDLAWEENIGRLLGTMSYESHEKPIWYVFVTILLGMMPWTLYFCGCLFRSANYHKWPLKPSGQLALVAAITVIVFYCIPLSKRSVYLLPAYPFMAYAITALITELRETGINRFFGRVMAWLGVIVPLIVIGLAVVPDNPFLPGFKLPSWFSFVVLAVPVVASIWWLMGRTYSSVGMPAIWSLLFAYGAAVMPVVFAEPLHTPEAREAFESLKSAPEKYSFTSTGKSSSELYNYYINDGLPLLPPG
ncbi:MAG: glycosyltransferase family 39 protein, partial [Muribaculaceae bacterium]|nr:glycosyltransferase family 39 protein [Muribaculaceae bacterium]